MSDLTLFRYHLDMSLKSFINACLRGSGQVLFQNNSSSGGLFLLSLFAASWTIASSALCGLIASTLIASRYRSGSASLENGLYGYNGLLIGAMAGAFIEKNFIVVSIIASAVSVVFQFLVERYFKRIPLLTFPFVFISWIVLLIFPVKGTAVLELPQMFVFFHNISQVFLVGNSLSGILILIGLFMSSRTAFTWTVAASFICILVTVLLNVQVLGFSGVLTAIALGTVFPRKKFITLLAILLTVFGQIILNLTIGMIHLPALTSPFILIVWLFLLAPGVKTFDSR